ncbi:MAG: methionine adenosyltransferase [Armatimonadetes bacterium]|nr:methionine adenosyltransferase [Armatimonadota bacterium]
MQKTLVERNIVVGTLQSVSVADQEIEIVERKGIGHPDSICDSIMERVSINLCKAYHERFGHILHHNIDKAFLVAGETEVRLGGGTVKDPMLLIFGDRATYSANGKEVPVAEIAVETAKRWIRENLRFVDPEAHVRYRVEIKPGSPELVDIFSRDVVVANDTSAAVGYAPLSETERTVKETERFLNSREFKAKFPEAGEDIKVMGFRQGKSLALTVAVAFVDRFIDSEATYFRRKRELTEAAEAHLRTRCTMPISLAVNHLDEPGRGLGGMYLSVLGTSAESGDSGQIGRGNRVNGLIAVNRPMGTEAAAGKNPVSHVGKIYTILTHQVAQKVYEELHGKVREVYVSMCSRIGAPIDQPKIASAAIILEKGARRERVLSQVRDILDRELADIHRLTRELSEGKYPVC